MKSAKRSWALSLLCLFLSGFACAVPGYAEPKPEFRKTQGQDQDWHRDFLAKHLLAVEPGDGAVRFQSDGKVGILTDDRMGWLTDFTLKPKQSFIQSPDHHASTTYTVQRIDKEAVVLEYKAQFDHRSFGPNMITEDSGELIVAYRGISKTDGANP